MTHPTLDAPIARYGLRPPSVIGRSCRGRSRIDPADGLHRPCHGTCDAFHPVIGRTDSRDRPGTWITFNVGDDPVLKDECTDVMGAFFQAGGRMIDCSPCTVLPSPS